MIKTVKSDNSRSTRLTIISKVYQAYGMLVNGAIPFMPSDRRYNISICHERRFLWYRVAKVGTRTIFGEFDKYDIRLDADHPFRCHYPVHQFEDYFKFAFVRNPWDRLASTWRNKVRDSNHFRLSQDRLEALQDFGEFIEFVSSLDLENCDPHIRLQCRLIDLNHVDFIGRFETFEEDFREVMRRIGIELDSVERRNATVSTGSYHRYFDDSTRAKVAQLYARDIAIFGYSLQPMTFGFNWEHRQSV